MTRRLRVTVTIAVLAAAAAAGHGPAGAAESTSLAAARAATARYHDPAVAVADGFQAFEGDECAAAPEGGMGEHHGNLARLDFVVDEAQPEVLLYEPTSTGLRLVGLEYVALAPADQPPTLFGQTFAQGSEIMDGVHIWALHAWVWRHNPAGDFAPWNVKVRCPAV